MHNEIVLRVEGVIKDFDGLRALNNVSFSVRQGGIKGIIGPNGSGKTTLFNVISGIYKPTAGEVFFKDRSIHNLRPSDIARLGIGRTFQIVRPFRNLTVLHNVLAALGHKFYHETLKPLFLSPKREYVEEAYRLLKLVGLEGYEDTPAKDLPLVFQRRLEVARALALKPILLMLDEPMAGLSLEAINEMMKLVSDLNKRRTTILLIEHNVRVAMELSNSIVVLNHGIKICEGTPDEVRSDPEVIEAYLGTRWGAV